MNSHWALILTLGVCWSGTSHALGFHDSHRRILSSVDAQRFLFAKLRIVRKFQNAICNTDNTGVMVATGSISPVEKAALIDRAGPDYFKWYRECVKTILKIKVEDLSLYVAFGDRTLWSNRKSSADQKILDQMSKEIHHEAKRIFFIPGLEELLTQNPGERSNFSRSLLPHRPDLKISSELVGLTVYQESRILDWNSINPDTRAAFVKHLIKDLVGPQVALRMLRYTGSESIYPGKPQTLDQLAQALITMPLKLSDGRAATLLDAYQFFAFAILTNPYLLEY